MSTCNHEMMTNHHAQGPLSQLAELVHTWRDRRTTRRELAQWEARDVQDAGFSWSEVVAETDKPFWRA